MLTRKTTPLLLIALLLAACTVAQIVQVINAAVTVLEEAAAATGIIPVAYVTYVSAASNCIAFAATEEASSDSPGVKATKITAQCSQLVSVTLPPGTEQNLVNLVNKLAAAIQGILDKLPAKNVLTAQPSATPAAPAEKLSGSDIKALNALTVRAQAAKKKIESRP